MFWHIFDLMEMIQPVDFLKDNCGNENKKQLSIPQDSYDKVMCALEFIFDQLFLSPSFSHLYPLFDKMKEGKTDGLVFTEIEEQFYICNCNADG